MQEQEHNKRHANREEPLHEKFTCADTIIFFLHQALDLAIDAYADAVLRSKPSPLARTRNRIEALAQDMNRQDDSQLNTDNIRDNFLCCLDSSPRATQFNQQDKRALQQAVQHAVSQPQQEDGKNTVQQAAQCIIHTIELLERQARYGEADLGQELVHAFYYKLPWNDPALQPLPHPREFRDFLAWRLLTGNLADLFPFMPGLPNLPPPVLSNLPDRIRSAWITLHDALTHTLNTVF